MVCFSYGPEVSRVIHGEAVVKKTWRQWFLTNVKRAIRDYAMIPRGDKVAVGVSGGKDSMALLYILACLRDYSHLSFTMEAIMVDPGWRALDPEPVKEFCADKKIPLHLIRHPIAQIIATKGEESACSLCAKLRAGVLNTRAKEIGCKRVALGHHLDDAVETFMLNLIHTGRMRTFQPVVYLDRMELYLIRPLVYLTEQTISSLVAREGIPVMPALCPYAGKTERVAMKEVVACITEKYPEFRRRFLEALQEQRAEDFWQPAK